MKHITGPDFPTGGIILGRAGIRDAYETGPGRVRLQARAHIEPLSHGKEAIVVTELPFQVKKGGDGGLIQKIADLVKEGRITEIANIDNVPRTLDLRAVIHNYVAHQREVIVRRTKHELREKEDRAHILEGLLTALDHLDEIIALIRSSRDRETAREQLIERFELTAIQATAILDLRLSQLTA